ncbi:DUF4913 domain-containing protein [Rhodococcoides corynebacterioides]|uniref:DUF4913 domain-containing protein n=1 Tax=Rhodococcoides corynebacterioides TaxID=53972 RepID=UPI003AE1A89B
MSDEFDLTDLDTASARPGALDAAPLSGQLGELVERAVGVRLAAEAEAIAQAQFEEMLTPELHTALADAVRRALTAVTTPEAEPGERGSVGEVGPYYPNAYRFFTEFLAPAYRRKTVDYPAMRWCPSWFCHPEARARVDALWRAWEYLRLDPATGMSVWWKDHADHHMAKLLSPDGTFKDCTPHHRQVHPLPSIDIPTELLTLDDAHTVTERS